MNSRTFLICILAVLLACPTGTVISRVIKSAPRHTPVAVDGRVHSPQELTRIIDGSPLVYVIEPIADFVPPDRAVALFAPPLDPSEYEREQLQALPDSIAARLTLAEKASSEKQFQRARLLCVEAFRLDTSQHMALERIGQTWVAEKQFDSAASYLEKSLELLPTDFSTRQLLGNTYWQMGDTTRAIRQLTIAHVLNRNQAKLASELRGRRAAAGFPWQDWSFEPRYRISADGQAVQVQSDTSCLGYALVKALWQYEPGYADAMRKAAPAPTSACNLIEEQEALRMLAASDKSGGPYAQIVDDNLAEACVLYEIALPRDPRIILSLDWPTVLKVADYVTRFH